MRLPFTVSKKIGIDLGTANSLVWIEGQGIVLSEETVVAISLIDNQVVAVGHEAKEMLGRTPGNIIASRPLRDGVIADYSITEAMLRAFIGRVVGRGLLIKPEVMICVPAGCTQVERRAVLDATYAAGARQAYLIDEPLAAAIGAHIPIAEPSGNMILDIGGGTAEAAVISLGGVVVYRSVRVGGNAFDEAIARHIRKHHGLVIGDQTAEFVKIQIGSAVPVKEKVVLKIKGRDLGSGMPKEATLTSQEITEALSIPLSKIVKMIKEVLESVPPELAADIIDKGIVMTGGSSTLKNLDALIRDQVGVPCLLAEDPFKCVIKGIGVALENLHLYKRSLQGKR